MKKIYACILMAMMAVCISCNDSEPSPTAQNDVIILMGQARGGYYDIVAMSPDGTQTSVIFAGGQHDTLEIKPKQASIGSDGQTLLFATNNESGIFTYDLLSGNLRIIPGTENTDFETPIFSPDMKSIIVWDDDSEKLLSIGVQDGSKKIIVGAGSFVYPSFYAGGKKLAVDMGWNEGIATMDKDGSNINLIALPGDSSSYKHPIALPRMNKVLAIKDLYSRDEIVLLDIDGRKERILLSDTEGRLESPSMNAQENLIAYRNSGAPNCISIARISSTGIGTSIANVPSIDSDGYNIWRPRFCSLKKEVYDQIFSAPQ